MFLIVLDYKLSDAKRDFEATKEINAASKQRAVDQKDTEIKDIGILTERNKRKLSFRC